MDEPLSGFRSLGATRRDGRTAIEDEIDRHREAGRRRHSLLLALALLAATSVLSPTLAESRGCALPILVYHRFGPSAADSMTVRTSQFEAQLKYLKDNGYHVVPLRSVVDCLRKRRADLPDKAVAITVDDGHRTVYTDMLPLIRRYRVPVTAFIYPSAISNASYAMNWEQLRQLIATGLFDVQSHAYWHPNFKVEKRRLSADQYHLLVKTQLERARRVIRERLDVEADMIAWPFGIYDDDLLREAVAQGIVAGFTIERRAVREGDEPMALPRYLMVDSLGLRGFSQLIEERTRDRSNHGNP
jgi:peptidoglycan/xylan/chitin deacetylase (PgdA/CDA1 family)